MDFPWGNPTHVCSPQTGSQDTPKSNLVKPLSVIGAHYRNMGEGLLRGAEMTQKGKTHSSVGENSQNGELGALGAACWQLSRLDAAFSRCLCWSEPLPGGSAGSCFSQPT